MDFSQIVKDIRNRLNISQEQLVREIHVSFATINRWENGKNSPNMLAKKAQNKVQRGDMLQDNVACRVR